MHYALAFLAVSNYLTLDATALKRHSDETIVDNCIVISLTNIYVERSI